MNYQHLQNIQSVIDESVKLNKVAGLNLTVYKDGKEVGYWQSGYADVETKKPFNRDTICRLYSMSKPVTAVAAWTLIEKGKLDLADEVGKFIPEYWNTQISTEQGRKGTPKKTNRNITIQDLLNMTSGYTYGAWWDGAPLGEHLTSDLINELNADCIGPCKISTMDFAKKLGTIPVSFEPGTNYSYGLSADILGAVIEVVTGKKFSEYVKEAVLDPLGMTDTGFYVPEEKQNRLSSVYVANNGSLSKFENPNLGIQPFMDHAPSFESGGAGLCSTLDDYLKFVLMLVNGGEYNGKRILQKKTVEYFSKARLRDNLQEKFNQNMEHLSGYTYCNLMRVAFEPGKCKYLTEEGEFGWDGWLGPYMAVDLKNNLIIVMLMQRTDSGTWELTRKLKNIIHSSL